MRRQEFRRETSETGVSIELNLNGTGARACGATFKVLAPSLRKVISPKPRKKGMPSKKGVIG